jgi:hypothetical protein
MSDRISVGDLTEALEVARWVCDAFDDYMLSEPAEIDETRFELLNRFINGGESAFAHTLAAAARLLVDNPAVLEALQDGRVVNREPISTRGQETG